MNVDLKVHDLQKGEQGTLTFESVEAAKTWLKARPQFTEVLGVASQITKDVSDELKACMRALDEDEKRRLQELEQAAAEEARQRAEAKRAEAQAEAERHRAEMANADPNRPMEVRYCVDEAMSLVDAADPREITPEAREAVTEWVKERNTWVESRGQVVGIAKVQVWPGPLPEGQEERVVHGNFVPILAPSNG
jgi:hypothetical protein